MLCILFLFHNLPAFIIRFSNLNVNTVSNSVDWLIGQPIPGKFLKFIQIDQAVAIQIQTAVGLQPIAGKVHEIINVHIIIPIHVAIKKSPQYLDIINGHIAAGSADGCGPKTNLYRFAISGQIN